MATGYYDSRGIWVYGEDDPASPFSTTLNLLAESASAEFANDRFRISALEDQWGTLTGSNVATPHNDVTIVDARAVVVPGVMASVHIRLGQVPLDSGVQNFAAADLAPALRPVMYFAPMSGWTSSGHVSGLVGVDGTISVRWSNASNVGTTVLSGSWPVF